jgi:hypothetical protein
MLLFAIIPMLSSSIKPNVLAQTTETTPSVVWQQFPSFEPKLLVDYPSAGYLTWNTTFGLYTIDKSFYWFSFKDRYGIQQISKSVFWINTTATIDIAKIANCLESRWIRRF